MIWGIEEPAGGQLRGRRPADVSWVRRRVQRRYLVRSSDNADSAVGHDDRGLIK